MCALQFASSNHVIHQGNTCQQRGPAFSTSAKFTCAPRIPARANNRSFQKRYYTRLLTPICLAQNERAAREPSVPGARFIPAIASVPGALALLSVVLRGASEASLIYANVTAVLAAALLFLLYFCTSLTEHRLASVSRLAAALRPAQDQLLLGSGLAAAFQLAIAAWLCVAYTVHGEGALVPLYGAGYASLAVLVASQRGRRLRGRKIFEIEAGEGERHSVMAQGSRLAARNYTWFILLLHLALQAATTAAVAAAGAGSVPAPAGGAGLLLLPPAVAAAYGALAVLYGAAGLCKFLPES
ncbi:hypothetical protein PLESTB_001054400 [Pleodorina starrii]|uniref:Uncharacterized protein n=1 Tax=Pleodorina starrii TaxID=330485 RepID=A0A9W6F4D1_9CHLO|nr:hypothetical protein PLESTB_001054400 [Pleodorina starrii]